MNDVIVIQGKVKYRITLDPTLWIFDDRRFDMSERFSGVDGQGMEFAPFLEHAEPEPEAEEVIIHREDGRQTVLTMEEAEKAVLQFSRKGKPIQPDGPALLYLADGSNQKDPMNFINRIEIR
ncbi:hypothetical protein [Paludifilum halophilum]|uniref:Peptidyl-prolyl cis-trans isomerase n=1 Tax=Paludifilum halophilum TaxID=1642702 RepID=A0A235B9Q7_9BACL|nr:hypothetical protein [Paludifilum halophilum]OYD08962.1 hypothetical protein CHM34_04080 [Paludifilum halophilum]